MAAPSEPRDVVSNQPQPGFMRKGCGFQSAARCFLRHLGGREPAHFPTHQREQLSRGFDVAVVNRFENLRYVAYPRSDTL
jgi:hypothetical protein